MAVTATPIFPQALTGYRLAIVNADGTTTAGKTIATAGANGSRVIELTATSTDTTARDLFLYITSSSVNYPIGCVSVPINAGNTNAIPAVNLLKSAQLPQLPLDANGNPFIQLAPGESLTCNVGAAVTSTKQVTIIGHGGDF